MMEQLQPILAALNVYGGLLISGLLVMLGGMLAILLLYRLVNRLIRPEATYARVLQVFFGAVYAMILVVTVLIAAERLGYDTTGLAGIAILLVIVGAVIVFFLIPFLPRLPFVPGHMVEIRGVMGTVEAVTAYQTVIRSFDGRVVFIPSAVAITGPISNYSLIPNRRVELNVQVQAQDDLERARTLLLELMSAHEAVLADPAPSVFVTDIADGRATLFASCWVANADWFATRDALWRALAVAFRDETSVSMAVPKLALEPTA